jgi:hypothetical protein
LEKKRKGVKAQTGPFDSDQGPEVISIIQIQWLSDAEAAVRISPFENEVINGHIRLPNAQL